MIDHQKAMMDIMARRKAPTRHATGTVNELPAKDTEGELDPKHMIAEEIMHAIHSKSVGSLAQALAAFHEIHKHESMTDEDSEM